ATNAGDARVQRLAGLPVQPFDESPELDDHALVGACAYALYAVGRVDAKRHLLTCDPRHLRLGGDGVPGRSGRQVLNVDPCSDRTFAGIEVGLMALSAAFSIIMIITGVASTGGSVASLKRLARCSVLTTSENELLAPTGIGRMVYLLDRRMTQKSDPSRCPTCCFT